MTSSEPLRPASRPAPLMVLLGLAAAAGLALGLAGCQAVPSQSAPSGTSLTASADRDRPAQQGTEPSATQDSVFFDGDDPAVANLHPELLVALESAAGDAAADEIEILVSSGWRSPELQERLLEEATDKYGSREKAARWVATPETSAHVSGEAVDIATVDGILWLSEHGAAYGLCQIYGNESWHFELRPEAVAAGCPPMYDDPTQDPRMQQ